MDIKEADGIPDISILGWPAWHDLPDASDYDNAGDGLISVGKLRFDRKYLRILYKHGVKRIMLIDRVGYFELGEGPDRIEGLLMSVAR